MGPLDGANLGGPGRGAWARRCAFGLMEAGAQLSVFDPDTDRVSALVARGAAAVGSPAALARSSDVVLSMVPDDAALLALVTGEDGVAGAIGAGQMFIDLSTVSPAASARVAEALAARGAGYLRCPVSGSTVTAAAGMLTIFCSGDPAAMDRAAGLLGVLGRETLHVGRGEEARAVKLLVNMVVAVMPAVLGEALFFGERLGLDRGAVVDALASSVVASPLLAYKAAMLKARDWTPAADVDLVAKDLDLALAVGAREGAPMPLSAMARQFAAAFQASGEGGLDFFRVSTWPERLAASNPGRG